MIGMTDQNKPMRYVIANQTIYTYKAEHSARAEKKCETCAHEKKYKCTHPDEAEKGFYQREISECFEKRVYQKGHIQY